MNRVQSKRSEAPAYAWSCYVCAAANPAGRGNCPACGNPANMSMADVAAAKAGEPGSTSGGMCSYSACTHARGSDQPFESADIKRLRRSSTREERSILVLCRRRRRCRSSHFCRPDLGRKRPVAPHGRRWSGHARILGSVRLDSSGRTRCLGARRAMRGIARLHRHRVPYESQIGLVDRRGAAWNPGTEDPAWLTSLRAAVTTGGTFRPATRSERFLNISKKYEEHRISGPARGNSRLRPRLPCLWWFEPGRTRGLRQCHSHFHGSRVAAARDTEKASDPSS